MRYEQTVIVVLFYALIASPGSPARADGNIVLAAPETAATVTPRPARLKLVNLPRLEFALRAAIQCNGQPVSVTLSVADTHRTISGEALEGQRAAETTLSVPARQLALAASSNFCIAGDAASADELLVTGFATAHASLRCRSNDRLSAHFASAPLSLKLKCERDVAQPPSDEPEPR